MGARERGHAGLMHRFAQQLGLGCGSDVAEPSLSNGLPGAVRTGQCPPAQRASGRPAMRSTTAERRTLRVCVRGKSASG